MAKIVFIGSADRDSLEILKEDVAGWIPLDFFQRPGEEVTDSVQQFPEPPWEIKHGEDNNVQPAGMI